MASKMRFHERVGKRIKEIREECGVALQELAAESGIGKNILELIESGKRDIKISELYNISKALGVRISSFVNPCDYKLYEKRKEESIDRYIPLKSLSDILDIGDSAIRELCKNDEMPYLLISRRYFFKASEVNEWLEHHCGVKKKIKEDQSKRFKIYGIEPLISAKEAGQILGCSWHFVFSLRGIVPYFKIGGRIKFRLSDIENYRDRKKIESWEIAMNHREWKSSFTWPEPSSEEKMVKEASWERSYKEDARPGYIVKEKNFDSVSFEELKQDVQKFIDAHIPVKSNLLGYGYYIIQRNSHYGCRLKWWSLPEGRENCRVHSTGLNSDSPDKLRDMVERLKKKIPKEDLIDIDYYSWRYSFSENDHHARITYYLPKINEGIEKLDDFIRMARGGREELKMTGKNGRSRVLDVSTLVRENNEKWVNINLTEVNDSIVRLGIFEGEFHWHKHNLEDELFFVLEGRLLLDLEGETIELMPWQGYTVPRQVIHRTRAKEKTVVLMVEGNTVNPRGDA